MAEVTMSLEEYLQLLDGRGAGPVSDHRTSPRATLQDRKKARRRVGKKDPKMARALKKANAMGRKKAGGFKKGWSQGKIMRKAHQLRRKMR
tara:strand:+ start:1685 stop:1957 length:273 start_codon:yes stop_codon:yes gene_type:complete